jgi:dipeptidase E
VRFLLTSDGINNSSIHDALVGLLGKPISESDALFVPTATYAMGGPVPAWRLIAGQADTPLCELGWKSLGVLELTALPSLGRERWLPWVEAADALLVGGGDALYLCHWLRESGLADLLPSLCAVYVGVSGGSMAMTPNVGEKFVAWKPPAGGDAGLGIVDFAIFPHLDDEELRNKSMTDAEHWAAEMLVPAYAIDGQTAIQVTDDTVEVISEGHWNRFSPARERAD